MKRILCGVLALVLSLALGGCGGTDALDASHIDSSEISDIEQSRQETKSDDNSMPSQTSATLKQGDVIYNCVNGIIGRYSNSIEVKEIKGDDDHFVQVNVSVDEEKINDFVKSCSMLFALYLDDAPMENYDSIWVFFSEGSCIILSNEQNGDPRGWTSLLIAADKESQYGKVIESAYTMHFYKTDMLMRIS